MRVPVVRLRLKEGVNDETGAGQQQARHNEQQPAPLARVQALPAVALPALSNAHVHLHIHIVDKGIKISLAKFICDRHR